MFNVLKHPQEIQEKLSWCLCIICNMGSYLRMGCPSPLLSCCLDGLFVFLMILFLLLFFGFLGLNFIGFELYNILVVL